MRSRHDDFVVMVAGDTICALPLGAVREIVFLPELVTPPTSPPILAGLLNLQGEAIPVVALDVLFRETRCEPGLYAPVVIVRVVGQSLGVLVRRVLAIAAVETESLLPLPPGHSFQDCATGSFAWRDGPVVALCPERLLTQQETRRLESFRDLERERHRQLEAVAP